MKRFRALAAFLGCLAVLASGFMNVAAAATAPASLPAQQERNAIGEQPCSHCDGCGDTSCPMPAATCLQASSNAAPTLPATIFDLPAISAGKVRWSLLATFLSGLSPPPDPFPPRA
jgi:hypothetical protein